MYIIAIMGHLLTGGKKSTFYIVTMPTSEGMGVGCQALAENKAYGPEADLCKNKVTR